MACRTLFLLLVALVAVSESAKKCYSGSATNFQSRPCDTGVDGKYVCQKFNCEGGRSPFILRTCASKNLGCMAGPAISFENFTVRACGDWGSRCEASATVCAEQGGVGQCLVCEDDLCNHANTLFLSISFLVVFRALF